MIILMSVSYSCIDMLDEHFKGFEIFIGICGYPRINI